MTKEVIDAIRSAEVAEELARNYGAIRKFYEELYGGPRAAACNREYFVVRDAERALISKSVALKALDLSSFASLPDNDRRQVIRERVCNTCRLAAQGLCPVDDPTTCYFAKEVGL